MLDSQGSLSYFKCYGCLHVIAVPQDGLMISILGLKPKYILVVLRCLKLKTIGFQGNLNPSSCTVLWDLRDTKDIRQQEN